MFFKWPWGPALFRTWWVQISMLESKVKVTSDRRVYILALYLTQQTMLHHRIVGKGGRKLILWHTNLASSTPQELGLKEDKTSQIR